MSKRYERPDRSISITPDGRAYLVKHGLVPACELCGKAQHHKPLALVSDGRFIVMCAGAA